MIQDNMIVRITAFSIFLKRGQEEAERLYPEFKEMFQANKGKTMSEFLDTLEK